jgi:hypothetical protein
MLSCGFDAQDYDVVLTKVDGDGSNKLSSASLRACILASVSSARININMVKG